jgi:hypothetical protein
VATTPLDETGDCTIYELYVNEKYGRICGIDGYGCMGETCPYSKAYSLKEKNIIVNGRPMKWSGATISYQEIVELATGKAPKGPEDVWTVVFNRGPSMHRQGSLYWGSMVARVVDDMTFDVGRTGNA